MENKKIRCGVCNTKQTVRRKKEEQDESLKQMVREGTLRPCPKCKMLTMKEFGVCNVIDVSGVLQCLPLDFEVWRVLTFFFDILYSPNPQCQQCAIVWNWQTKETGRTSRELKQRARSKGTLWGRGELAYQQNLQRYVCLYL